MKNRMKTFKIKKISLNKFQIPIRFIKLIDKLNLKLIAIFIDLIL